MALSTTQRSTLPARPCSAAVGMKSAAARSSPCFCGMCTNTSKTCSLSSSRLISGWYLRRKLPFSSAWRMLSAIASEEPAATSSMGSWILMALPCSLFSRCAWLQHFSALVRMSWLLRASSRANASPRLAVTWAVRLATSGIRVSIPARNSSASCPASSRSLTGLSRAKSSPSTRASLPPALCSRSQSATARSTSSAPSMPRLDWCCSKPSRRRYSTAASCPWRAASATA